MNDDMTKVIASAMSTGISDLNQAHKALVRQLGDLKAELSQSLGQWDGAAREAYGDVQQQWDKSADKMADIAHKMTTVLTEITENYGNNERIVKSSWH